MEPLTHIATGVALSQLVRTPSRAKAALAGFLFAVLPDLDFILTFNDRLSFLKHHRGFSHSLPALLLFTFLGAVLGRLLGGPRWFRPLLLIGFLVLTSHLFLDWITSYGTQLLNPFTQAKFSLDWVFIIDPYLTALVVVGAIAALWSAGRGRKVGAVCLSLAGVYVLLCGFYHHQALNLAQRVFQPNVPSTCSVAALPQPFSLRRWQLLAVTPGEIRQAFVKLPYWPLGINPPLPAEILVKNNPHTSLRVPSASYRPPGSLEVYRWQAAALPAEDLPPEARPVLETYLGFARFPLLAVSYQERGEMALTWLDLRFSIPGRTLPFTLHLRLDKTGNLASWSLRGGRPSFKKPPASSRHPG